MFSSQYSVLLDPFTQAVRLKEKKVASEIVAVSCGPQQCQVR